MIRLTTGHAARALALALGHPFTRREPVLALDFGHQLAHAATRFARSIERGFHGLPDGQGGRHEREPALHLHPSVPATRFRSAPSGLLPHAATPRRRRRMDLDLNARTVSVRHNT